MEKQIHRGFIDAEFNCLGRRYNEPVSIGCVITNEKHEVIDRFYEVVKPVNDTILSEDFFKYVGTVTQEEVDGAEHIDVVLGHLKDFLEKYDVHCLHSWSYQDKNNIIHALELTGNTDSTIQYMVNHIYDLQPTISARIVNQAGGKVKKRWGLLLAIAAFSYDLPEQVINKNQHNSLADAENLALLFKLFKEKKTVIYTCEVIEKVKEAKEALQINRW